MKYVLGLLGVAFGALMVIKTEWIVSNLGANAWAEQHLGSSGGSRLLYKFIGLAIIFIAMMGATGMLGPFIISIFGKLFGLKNN